MGRAGAYAGMLEGGWAVFYRNLLGRWQLGYSVNVDPFVSWWGVEGLGEARCCGSGRGERLRISARPLAGMGGGAVAVNAFCYVCG